MLIPKHKPVLNKKYTDWIRGQPSVVSGVCGVEPHHIKRKGFGGGMKPDDIFTIPLTREEHTYFHSQGWAAWEERTGIDQYEECCKLIQRYNREVGL